MMAQHLTRLGQRAARAGWGEPGCGCGSNVTTAASEIDCVRRGGGGGGHAEPGRATGDGRRATA